MTDEQRLQMITEQLILVRDNLFRGMSKSMQKLQARSINEVLELPNHTQSLPAQLVYECSRSHPHENMDAMCELRTEIARLTNENARLKAQPEHGWTPKRIAGIARLKDAQDKRLAQPEQEPVTWRYKIVDVFGRPVWTLKTPNSDTRVLESQPLYTTPPQRKPLTDEQRDAIARQAAENDWHDYEVIDAVEAAHGIYAPTERKGEA